MSQVRSERALLREIAGEISVTRFLSYREFLSQIYNLIKSRVESYSYLQYAEDLGFSKTNVVRLMIAGERPLTEKAAEKAAARMNLKSVDRRYWMSMVRYNNERVPAEREKHFQEMITLKQKDIPQEIDQRYFEYFSEWYYPVIREVVSLGGFNGDPEWVRDRIGFPLRLEEVKKALALLEKLGFLATDPNTGMLTATDAHVVTQREIDSLGIVRYHQKMIELGRESITRVDEDQRDIRAMTFRLKSDQVAVAKAKVDEFLADLIRMEQAAGNSGEVYQLNVQLFPFTKHRG